ncbi:hypothetical protein C8F04DRAFT_1187575 [Mycena alexandri]|uniref:Uncharacterized protein n=1 Tax=Mycena alexandri TaxID=1745969 RepID=A0AAD6SLW5_9AGAR|nr:hypothetical protein C8F04DRAFT_1187575 [Mycena alexandri]
MATKSPPDPVRVTSYNVSITEVMQGLPPSEQAKILAEYRTSFHRHAAERSCQRYTATYDIACQYFKNIDTMKADIAAHKNTDDEDSIFSDSDDDGPPPLEPISPSTPGSTDGDVLDLVLTTYNGRTLYVPPNISAILSDGTQPPPSGSDANLLATDDSVDEGSAISTDVSEKEGAVINVPATVTNMVLTDGEAIERAWLEEYLPPPGSGMPQGYCHSSPALTGPVHDLQIIGLYGVRNVLCDCADGKHTIYKRHQEFAYVDSSGDLVVKKSKMLLLPLN